MASFPTLVPRDEYLAPQRRELDEYTASLGPIDLPIQRQELSDFAASLGPLSLPDVPQDVPEDVSRRRDAEELAAFTASLPPLDFLPAGDTSDPNTISGPLPQRYAPPPPRTPDILGRSGPAGDDSRAGLPEAPLTTREADETLDTRGMGGISNDVATYLGENSAAVQQADEQVWRRQAEDTTRKLFQAKEGRDPTQAELDEWVPGLMKATQMGFNIAGAGPTKLDDLAAAKTPLLGLKGVAEESLERVRGTANEVAELRPPEPNFAANIRLEKFAPEIRGHIQQAADDFDGFAGQRRGVISDPEAQKMAAETALGTTVERWLQTKPGKAFNQEEALALGNTLGKVGKEYDDLLASVAGRAKTADEEALLAEKALELAALAGVRSGAAAEAGRTLRSFRIALTGDYGSRTAAIQKAFEAIGTDTAKFGEWVEAFSKLPADDTVGRYKMLQALHTPTAWEKLSTWRYASMLSSWKTHLANATSNLGESLSRPIETAAAGYGREALGDLKGMAGALPDGWAAFRRTLASGVTPEQAAKTDRIRPGRAFGDGLFGRAINLPLDLLSASDELFKTVNTAGALRAQAVRLAKTTGRSVDDLLADPTPEMIDRAHEIAVRSTFQEDPGKLANWLLAGRNDRGAMGAAIGFVLPFVKTPANIFRRGLEMSARATVVPGLIETGVKAARGDVRGARLAAAKTGIASMAGLGFLTLAGEGNLSGAGPKDPGKRRLLEATGWQPHSIKIGDRWLAYNNLGPISVEMGLIANAVEGLREGIQPDKNLADEVLRRMVDYVADTSFVSGIGDLFQSARQGSITGAAESLVGNTAGTMMPYGSFLAAAERVGDPEQRTTQGDNLLHSTANRLAGRVPVLNRLVPPEPGALGETRTQGDGNWAAQIFLPWRTSAERPDPVAGEVARLIQTGNNVGVREISRNDKYAGEKQTGDQRRALQGELGTAARAYLSEWVARPEYRRLNDKQKAETLNKALGVAYKMADLEVGEKVNRDPAHKALMAWAQTPQYAAVKGSPTEIAKQNAQITEARAKQAEYRKEYGRDQGDARLFREDREAWKLAQRERLDTDFLRAKRKRIDAQFGVDTEKAEREGLVGAGNTVLQPPQGFTAPVAVGSGR